MKKKSLDGVYHKYHSWNVFSPEKCAEIFSNSGLSRDIIEKMPQNINIKYKRINNNKNYLK